MLGNGIVEKQTVCLPRFFVYKAFHVAEFVAQFILSEIIRRKA